jgi:hypothetical protein
MIITHFPTMGRSRTASPEQGLLFHPEQLIPVPVAKIRTLIAAALATKVALLPLLEHQATRVVPPTPSIRRVVPLFGGWQRPVLVSTPEPDNTLMHLRQQITVLKAHASSLTPETRPLVAEYIAGKIMDLANQNLDSNGTAKAFPFTLGAIEQALASEPAARQVVTAALNTVERAIMEEMATLGEYELVRDIPEGSGLSNVFDSLGRLERICADCYKQQKPATKTK